MIILTNISNDNRITVAPVGNGRDRSLPVAAAVLDVGVEPVEHFDERVQNRFARFVVMPFERQNDEADGAAVPLDRAEHTLTLYRKGARVRVVGAMQKQDRLFDLAGVGKG